ncbi:uroporphyrinogen-III synthase [Psychrosphaera haliotis]|uniref:Uroporphyrinogen-III synthase n=1 Tax=Psychrosphaera haliotis TaxID=555083 RepID=A0A6N8FF46_9GAMM|nr:uroporphyrinogen-III synthase [Psychrosphaera haliotis]MUH73302.1 hypothetical protein [Psychrosphaera haliotis]
MSSQDEQPQSIQLLNTRPTPMGEELTVLLDEANISSIHSPAISIEPTPQPSVIFNALLSSNTLFIFVSKNAVKQFFEAINKHPELLNAAKSHQQLFAVGEGTAEYLAQLLTIPKTNIHYPLQSDSDGLLAMAAFNHANTIQSAIIVKGNDGRELIKDTLIERGFEVSEWSLYKRIPNDFKALSVPWTNIQTLLATSIDIANALVNGLQLALDKSRHGELNDPENFPQYLNKWQWLVFSPRIKVYLQTKGIDDSRIIICEQMNNSSIINSIQRLAK